MTTEALSPKALALQHVEAALATGFRGEAREILKLPEKAA